MAQFDSESKVGERKNGIEGPQSGSHNKRWGRWFAVAGLAAAIGCGSESIDNYIPNTTNTVTDAGEGGAKNDAGTMKDSGTGGSDAGPINDGGKDVSDGGVLETGTDAAQASDGAGGADSAVPDSGLTNVDSGVCVPVNSSCSSQHAISTLNVGGYLVLGDNQIQLFNTEIDYGTPRAIVTVNDSCSTLITVGPVYDGTPKVFTVGSKSYTVNVSSIVTSGTKSATVDVTEGCADAGVSDGGTADSGGIVTDSGVVDSGMADSGFGFDSGVTDSGVCVPVTVACTDQSNSSVLNVGSYIAMGDKVVFLNDTELDYGTPRAIVSVLDSCGNLLQIGAIDNGNSKEFVIGSETYTVAASTVNTNNPKTAKLNVTLACPSVDGGVIDSGVQTDSGSEAEAGTDAGAVVDSGTVNDGGGVIFPPQCPYSTTGSVMPFILEKNKSQSAMGYNFVYTGEVDGGGVLGMTISCTWDPLVWTANYVINGSIKIDRKSEDNVYINITENWDTSGFCSLNLNITN